VLVVKPVVCAWERQASALSKLSDYRYVSAKCFAHLTLFAVVLWWAVGCTGSCDEDRECLPDEPQKVDFTIKLTINDENKSVPITVFIGNYDDRVAYFRDTLATESYTYSLPKDQRYSVEAVYRQNGRVILAIDDDRVSTSRSYNCDEPCWSVNTGVANVRIRNYF
jgi:hypothetical protein